jgi:nicotinate-nucleotide adenylyltransferase
MRLGVFGGSFNPPHLGHLQLAQEVQTALKLDAIMWIPTHKNPLKKMPPNSPTGRQRLAMVQAMIAGHDTMFSSDIEITRGGPSYTWQTLEELQAAQPSAHLFLLMGADSLKDFMQWHFPDRILKSARLAAVIRPGYDLERLADLQAEHVKRKLDWVEMEPSPISSTDIRAKIAKGHLIDDLVHPEVARIIAENGYYQSKS